MKTVLFSLLAMTFQFYTVAQETPSKKIPPMKTLPGPGNIAKIYELPDSLDYKIFSHSGELIESGKAEFIDYTNYKPGTYFIRYNGKTEQFISSPE